MAPGEKMFKDLSIKKKLYLSFGAILAIILVLLSIAYKQFSSLSEANEWDRHTMDVIHSIDQLQLDLLQVQVEARGYYLTGSPERLERTRTEMGDLPASILKLQKLTLDRSEEHTSELQSHRDLHSFPTRRSSDLARLLPDRQPGAP